jgi:hypothetical protein
MLDEPADCGRDVVGGDVERAVVEGCVVDPEVDDRGGRRDAGRLAVGLEL